LKVKGPARPALRNERDIRKERSTVEKTIARLDEQKKLTNTQLMSTTGASEALRLHNLLEDLAKQLTDAEERWCVLQEELDALGQDA
jgi:ATP-binding cassette subfamily F protein 3